MTSEMKEKIKKEIRQELDKALEKLLVCDYKDVAALLATQARRYALEKGGEIRAWIEEEMPDGYNCPRAFWDWWGD